jgi:HSP20 family protein
MTGDTAFGESLQGVNEMAIERWSPFADVRKFDEMFERLWSGGARIPETVESWGIPLDIQRAGDDIVVTASLPGVDKDKVDVTIEDSVLTIRASVEEQEESKHGGFLLRERRTGSFYRAVRLPESVDAEHTSSSYKDGVLTIRLPKLEEKKARKVAITTA